ncbi:MAG: hypothetical protein GC161_07115 [Planctomycetaceae bacterium]|nr:hypothetical protein [Planctomycetaceae bacterium]
MVHPAWTLFALLSAIPARADVLVVDKALGPGADFATIQAAVDAAVDGDIVIVRPATYDGFAVNGKGLSILAESKTRFAIEPSGRVVVSNLGAGQSFVLRGAEDDPDIETSGGWGSEWEFQNCAGTIWVEDCNLLHPSAPSNPSNPGDKVQAEGVTRLFVVRSTLVGARGQSSSIIGQSGGAGIAAKNCGEILVFDSELVGGQGGFGSGLDFSLGGIGGSALAAVGCERVYVAGTRLVSGDGGDTISEGCDSGGNGGVVLDLSAGVLAPTTPTTLRDCKTEFGVGGINLDELCPLNQGATGTLLEGDLVALVFEPGAARSVSAPTLVREGDVLRFVLGGSQGDLGFLLLGIGLSSSPLPGVGGLLLVDPVVPFVFAGTLATDSAVLAVTVPSLPPGVDIRQFPVQGLFVSPTLEAVLGSATQVALLDASF